MPEESSAAKEHAIISEITTPLASLPDNAVPAVADVEFPTVLRGYDRLAVDAYVKRTSQLVAELQSTRSPEAAVRRALERVGEEVSAILQRAHDAAAQITAQSRSDAEDRLEVSRREAAQITVDARNRLKDLDAETDRIWAERQRIVEDTQVLARQLLSLAGSAADRFPADDDTEGEPPAADAAGEESAEHLWAERPKGAALNGEDPAWDPPEDEPELEVSRGPDVRAGEEPELGASPEEGGELGASPEEGGELGASPEEANPAPRRAPDAASEHSSTPFDEDATAIMPQVKPDEGEDS